MKCYKLSISLLYPWVSWPHKSSSHPKMKPLRIFSIALGIGLVLIVAFASLRAPKGSALGASAINPRARFGSVRPRNVKEDLVRLQRAAENIDREIEHLADSVLVHGDDDGEVKSGGAIRASVPVPKLRAPQSSIFVGFASFRDTSCPHTVASIFTAAADASRVFVGIAELHETKEEPSCLHPMFEQCQLKPECFVDNIRTRKVSHKVAKGRAHGKYLAMLLYRGEDYVLMIDSHTRFAPKWDKLVVEMYTSLQKSVAKPILSYRPEEFQSKSENEKGSNFDFEPKSTSLLCKASFDNDGILTFGSTVVPLASAPKIQPFLVFRFIFANGSLLSEVPLDPYLPHLTTGDDMLYSARVWTHGWDIYSPHTQVAFHADWENKPVAIDTVESQHTLTRVQYLTETKVVGTSQNLVADTTTQRHVVIEADKYGMGSARSLDAYWEFGHIDTSIRKISKDWCV